VGPLAFTIVGEIYVEKSKNLPKARSPCFGYRWFLLRGKQKTRLVLGTPFPQSIGGKRKEDRTKDAYGKQQADPAPAWTGGSGVSNNHLHHLSRQKKPKRFWKKGLRFGGGGRGIPKLKGEQKSCVPREGQRQQVSEKQKRKRREIILL